MEPFADLRFRLQFWCEGSVISRNVFDGSVLLLDHDRVVINVGYLEGTLYDRLKFMSVIHRDLSFDSKVNVVIHVDDFRFLTNSFVSLLIIPSFHLVESMFGVLHGAVKPFLPLVLEGTFPLLTRGNRFETDLLRWFRQNQFER